MGAPGLGGTDLRDAYGNHSKTYGTKMWIAESAKKILISVMPRNSV